MTREELNARNIELLNGVKELFAEAGLEPELDDIGDAEVPQSVVCEFNSGLNNDAVLGQFYFLPGEGDAAVSYLVEAITLADDVDGNDKKLEMLQAVSLLNNQVPYGMFMMDPELSMLQYRYVIPVSAALDKAQAADFVNHELFTGIGLVSAYVAPLLTLLYDTIDWDDFQHVLEEYNAPVK